MVKFTASAKYILAGEHAVLRGSGALVFPLSCFKVELCYEDTGASPMVISCENKPLDLICHGAVSKALDFIKKPHGFLTGFMVVDSNIPMGVGFGFSAALSSVIARLLVALDLLDKKDFFACARYIEGHFHGVSSGVDIAGVNSNTGVYFAPCGKIQELELVWQPKLFLQLSGDIGLTSSAISLVQETRQRDHELAVKIDRDMAASVLLAKRALADSKWGFELLQESINLAGSCFSRWGLVHKGLESTARDMEAKGAVATKCTGSGGGGAMLGLWEKCPSSSEDLIKAI